VILSSQLNPTELIWATVKNWVVKRNATLKFLSQLAVDTFASSCEHVQTDLTQQLLSSKESIKTRPCVTKGVTEFVG
jgi:hypothetical protein